MKMIIMVVSWNVLKKLGEELSEKTNSLEGGMQPGVKTGVKPNASSFPVFKITNTVPITPNSMAFSVSQLDELIHVSFIHFNGL